MILKSCSLDELRPTEEERAALDGKRLLVGFSGGKDSSTAALWCRHFFPESKIELCFADLGADYVGMELFLREAAEALGGELKILRAKRNIIDVFLERKKWPNFMYPYCHDILHETLQEYWRQYDSSEVVIVLGRRLAEKSKTGKICENRFLEIHAMKGYQFFQPLYFAAKEVGENLLIEAGIPLWEGYKYGLRRTACRCCPGQRPSAYAAIRSQYPEVWQEMLRLEQIMGTGYWLDPDKKDKRSPLVLVADKGEAAFQEGNFPPRFRSDSL